MMPTLFAIVHYSTPVVILLAEIEAIVLWFARRKYDWRAYFASFADLMVRQYVIYVYLGFGLVDPLIGWAWQNRLMTVPLNTAAAVTVLFIGQEFCYYWFHRASHRVGLLWATHAVHHSTNELNLGAAYRFGWTGRLLGASLFFVPLIWLGFPPRVAFLALNLNLLYQFWLHTDWIPKLGPLEWVLNTPSHHRVHHAANPQYLDRNYGGVLIIFDRLFGTFSAEDKRVPCRYGLVEPLRSNNPVWIAFHAWVRLGDDLWRARGVWQRLRILFGPPGEQIVSRGDCAVAADPAQ